MLYSILVSLDVLIAAGLIGFVLLQQGQGASAGAAFGGGGSSGTVFGAKGSGSFMTRTTAILATAFFINSIVLAYLASHRDVTDSVMQSATQEQAMELPESASDIPGLINVPEGTTSEEMLDIIKGEIDKQADQIEKSSEEAAVISQEAMENTEDKIEKDMQKSMPSDIPQ